MEYLARKITRAKWMPKPGMASDDIRADAITGCLRTTDDTLSTWECTMDEDDIADVVLALAAAGSTVDKMDVVLLSKGTLESLGIRLEATPGRTAIPHLRSRHVDLSGLELQRLGGLATNIAMQVRNELNCYRFTRTRVLKLLQAAIENGKIEIELLDKKLQAELIPAS